QYTLPLDPSTVSSAVLFSPGALATAQLPGHLMPSLLIAASYLAPHPLPVAVSTFSHLSSAVSSASFKDARSLGPLMRHATYFPIVLPTALSHVFVALSGGM